MSSKLNVFATFLLVSSFFTSGCSVFKDPDKKTQEVKMGASGPDCLSEFPDQMLAFFEGTTTSDGQVDGTFNCVTNSLQFFLDRARGKVPNAYQAYELQNFVNTYFTKEHKLSDTLMNELMTVKVALFGGDTSSLTRNDVMRVIDLFNLLKKHSLILRKFMPLTPDNAKVLGAVTTGVMSLAVRNAADETGKFFESVGNNYNFSNATVLLKELELFFYPDPSTRDKENMLAWVSQRMELVQSLKGILISPDTTHINKSEWSKLFRVAARVHGLMLQMASESASHSGWLTEAGLDALDRIIPQALDLFHETRDARESSIGTKEEANKIQGPEIRNLILTLLKMKKQSDVFNTESDKFVLDVFAKTLIAKQLLLGGKADELDLDFLDRVPTLFQSIKKAIADLYPNFPIEKPETISDSELAAKSELLNRITRTAGKALSAFHAKSDSFSLEELIKLQDELEVLYAKPEKPTSFDFKELSKWFRVAEGAKGALVGTPYRNILASQWETILGLAGEGYLTYVKLLRPGPAAQNPAQQKWSDMAAHTNHILTFAARAASTHTIAVADAERLILSIPDDWMAEALPVGTTKSDLIPLLPPMYAIKAGLFPAGNANELSSSDFLKTRDIVGTVLKEWGSLSPYLPEKFEEAALKQWFEDFKKWEKPKIQEVISAIETAGDNVSLTLRTVKPETLARKNVERALDAAKPFLGVDMYKTLREVFPLGWAAKSIIVTPVTDTFMAFEWPYAFSAVGKWFSFATYGTWWTFQNTPASDAMFKGEKLYDLNDVIEKGLALLADTAARHEAYRSFPPGIRFENFFVLLDELEAFLKLKDTTLPMKTASLKAFIPPAVQKGFGGRTPGLYGRGAQGLTAQAVRQFGKHVKRWYRAQTMLQSLYVKLGNGEKGLSGAGFTRKELVAELGSKRLKLHEHSSKNTPRIQQEIDVLKEVRRMIELLPPYFLGNNSFVTFPGDGYRDQYYSYANAWRVNLSWMLGRILLESYAHNQDRAKAWGGGVTLEEFKEGVRDIWPILVDLKMSNPKKTAEDTAEKRFREGNLFTTAATGDEIFSIAEWTELMAVSFSLGHSSVRIYDDMLAKCEHADFDDYGKPRVRSKCARDMIFSEVGFKHYFNESYPLMTATYLAAARSDQYQMMADVEVASRDAGFSVAPYETADVDSIVVLFTYLESLFRKFDINRDNVFDVEETQAAFPVVCNLLKTAAKDTESNCATGETGSLEAIFGYLLFYGKVPSQPVDDDNVFELLGKGIAWGTWILDWWRMTNVPAIGYTLKADRSRMLRIFATLSSLTSTPPPAAKTTTKK